MILQLNPTIPVTTPKGKAFAIGWIDYGNEDDLYWICFQDDTCECWVWKNSEIRAQTNLTLGRINVHTKSTTRRNARMAKPQLSK